MTETAVVEVLEIEAPPTVHEAWSRVMAAVQSVGKTGHNKQQDYSFRGIDAVLNAAGPAMREHGVVVIPSLLDAQYRDIEVGKNRTTMREVTVRVRYTIFGPAGDMLVHESDPDFGVVPGESMDSGDKGTAKAMSVAYRTFLIQALTIPTHDPDPDEKTYERASRQDPNEPAASKDTIGRIETLVEALPLPALARLKAFVQREHLPDHPKHLSQSQAEKVLNYLAANPVTDEEVAEAEEATT